ncbi:hypothetical protein RA280_43730 [Cupriavidus sp. CV2]|uniref:hypothetical protein n=1 Tax=Cupriavidus ulmosensis TaxID=3065913 RepID=UPI00296AE652|nr:hypothetical protein [Cupriavidus sp. CV2]MDW3688520.1 hypothetical protein [Cupriavidus sp. CV2]
MSEVKFEPWIGANYATTGFRGLRLMLLGESHYGPAHHVRRNVTAETVRWLGQKAKGRFFTTTACSLLGLSGAHLLNAEDRAALWEQVVFYNFVQEFLPSPGDRPSPEAWRAASKALPEVVDVVRPDVIVVLGKGMQAWLPLLPDDIVTIRVNHPSIGYSYAEWNPVIAAGIAEALEKKKARAHTQLDLNALPKFREWAEKSFVAAPTDIEALNVAFGDESKPFS